MHHVSLKRGAYLLNKGGSIVCVGVQSCGNFLHREASSKGVLNSFLDLLAFAGHQGSRLFLFKLCDAALMIVDFCLQGRNDLIRGSLFVLLLFGFSRCRGCVLFFGVGVLVGVVLAHGVSPFVVV